MVSNALKRPQPLILMVILPSPSHANDLGI